MDYHLEGCIKSHSFICHKCGNVVHPDEYKFDSKLAAFMCERSVCFECGYWMEKLISPIPYAQIINHQLFSFPPDVNSGTPVRHILTIEGEILSSSRLYNYGLIPMRFWADFPNTANFISHAKYCTIKSNSNFECNRKGCWDRKNCLWYHGVMDWNVIPASHKLGAEKCPMFINVLNPMKK